LNFYFSTGYFECSNQQNKLYFDTELKSENIMPIVVMLTDCHSPKCCADEGRGTMEASHCLAWVAKTWPVNKSTEGGSF
jgi:hypothetical protein